MLDAAKVLLTSLEWEERRSGTTYNGYEMLKKAVASHPKVRFPTVRELAYGFEYNPSSEVSR